MRRSASEIIRNLEMRIARLERKAYTSFIQEALDIMFLDMGGHRDRVYSSSEATEAIDVHLELLTNEEEHLGRTLRSERDYDNFARDVYGTPDALAKAVDPYLRGKRTLGVLQRRTPRKASSSRLAQESFKRGDMVMILTVKPGQNGSYSNPGRVEAVMGDEVRVSVGMAQVIKPAKDLVKATGRKSENVKIWRANH